MGLRPPRPRLRSLWDTCFQQEGREGEERKTRTRILPRQLESWDKAKKPPQLRGLGGTARCHSRAESLLNGYSPKGGAGRNLEEPIINKKSSFVVRWPSSDWGDHREKAGWDCRKTIRSPISEFLFAAS